MPTQEHATILEQKIETTIEEFEADMETYIANNYMQTQTDQMGNFTTCLEGAETAFTLSWVDTNTTPSIGVMPDVTAAYTECQTEMMNFRLKITEVINEMRDGYVEEAQVQQHLAKTDFLKLVAATIKKIHDVSGLTEEEKDMLMQELHEKRTEFGDEVMTYI